MPYPLRTRSANACIPSKACLQNCGAPSVPLCEPDSGLLRRVPPLKKNSGVGNCSCWPRACSCIGSWAMHASPPKSSSAAAISLCGGCGHSCSTKPHKLPAHPSPPPRLRRPRMLGGLPAPLVHLGQLSAAARALVAEPLVPGTDATLAELRDPARRPPEPYAPLHARSPPHNFWHRFEAPVGERQQAPPGRPMNISESSSMMRRMVGFSTSSPSVLPKPMSRRWPSLHSELAAWSRCASPGEACGPLLSEMSLGASLGGS